MEKRLPHYPLAQIQSRIADHGAKTFTATALFNVTAMGLPMKQALDVLATLNRAQFYKSMTTHANSSIWQDVYLAPTPVGKMAYIKLTLQQGAVVIQFKEK